MNWELFSTVGYISVALWLCVPLLWLVHEVRRPRRWWCHVALGVGAAAFVLATINSRFYVGRIQIDRSEQIAAQMARRQAAKQERMKEVAPIQFAEDASDDRLDKAGMDEADLAFFESIEQGPTPQWKQQKKQRDADAGNETQDLEALIGAGTAEQEGLTSQALTEEQTPQAILMSDADKLAADRLDAANLMIVRIMLLLGGVYLVVDYFRRLNIDNEAYYPLPVPSRWADALTPRAAVATRQLNSRQSLLDAMRTIVRRGEVFVCMTEDAGTARSAAGVMARLPAGLWPIQVIAVADEPALTDEDVFETLWYGRHCFVVDSADRAARMLDSFVQRLAERRETRACARQTVHVIWDIAAPVAPQQKQHFARLGQAAGFRLLLRSEHP